MEGATNVCFPENILNGVPTTNHFCRTQGSSFIAASKVSRTARNKSLCAYSHWFAWRTIAAQDNAGAIQVACNI